MVSDILPRTPAWQSLRPASPTFGPIEDERAGLLVGVVGSPASVWRMGIDHGALHGSYRLTGDRDLFLKVVEAGHRDSQLASDRIARHLASRGVSTLTCLDGYPRDLPDGHALFAFDFVDGRFAEAEPRDIAGLGRAVGQLHRVLADAPFAARVLDLSRDRDDTLERYRLLAMSDGGVPEHVTAIVTHGDTCHVATSTQVIHGDLNYTNALFPLRGDEPLLLDFEDCRFSHLPRLVDLAMALERFVLVAEAENDDAFDLGQALIRAYRAADPRPFDAGAGDLSSTLRTLAIRALVLLCEMRRRGEEVEDAEVGKFVELHAQATARDDLLTELSRMLP